MVVEVNSKIAAALAALPLVFIAIDCAETATLKTNNNKINNFFMRFYYLIVPVVLNLIAVAVCNALLIIIVFSFGCSCGCGVDFKKTKLNVDCYKNSKY